MRAFARHVGVLTALSLSEAAGNFVLHSGTYRDHLEVNFLRSVIIAEL